MAQELCKKHSFGYEPLKVIGLSVAGKSCPLCLAEENAYLQAENKRLKEALEIAYEAYKDKCTGKKYTVKQIGRVHRFCKQALQAKKGE